VLRATRVLSFAALAAAVLTCLTFGVGDVSDPLLLLWLRSVQWLAIALGLFWALRERSAPTWRVVVPLAGWLSVLMLSAVAAPAHRDEAVATLTRPISGALLAWAVYAVAWSPKRWLLLSGSVASGGLIVTVVGLADVAGVQPVQSWLSTLHDGPVPVGDVPRLASLLSHPNVAASVLELTLPLLVAATIDAARAWRAPMVAALLLQLVALSLTFSRAGMIGALAALAVLAAFAARQGARQVLAPVGVAAVAAPMTLGFAAATLPPVEHRMLAELEQASYRATYAAPSQVTVAPDQVVEVPVTVTNVSSSEWTALDNSRVALGYHLLRADGTPLEFDSPAILVPADLPPLASLPVVAHVRAPAEVGLYVVEWDALREGVAWFSWRGSVTTATALVVIPNAPARPAPPEAEEVAMPRPARIQYWLAAWAMLRDFPVLGVGPDNFRLRFSEYTGAEESHIGTHAHSVYLESLADSGVLGFAALCGFLIGLLWYVSRGLTADRYWPWRGALLASLVAWLVHGLVDDFERFLPTHLAFWIVVGLAVRGRELLQRAQRPE
jgi:O-antigen ligase/polysaccharide polymerase Wzy-like membrane protein